MAEEKVGLFSESDAKKLAQFYAQKANRTDAKRVRNRRTVKDRVDLTYGKVVTDMTPDTAVGEVEIWDKTQNPPVSTGEKIEVIRFYWISDQVIKAGKEVAWLTVGGKHYLLWAECPDPPEANVAQIVEDAEIQSLPSFPLWGNLGSMTEAYRSGTSFGDHAGTSGLRVIEPGQYEVDFSFSATVDANNDSILLRSVTPNTTGAPLSYSARTAGDTISASFKLFATVTDADLAGGIVFILVEVSTDTNATVTWNHAEMSGKKISSNQDYTPGP